jgi:hypothetical protein
MNPVTPGAIMSIRLERDADREIIGDVRQLGARVVPLIDPRIRPRVPDAAAYSLDGFEEAIGPTVWRTEPAVMPLAPFAWLPVRDLVHPQRGRRNPAPRMSLFLGQVTGASRVADPRYAVVEVK